MQLSLKDYGFSSVRFCVSPLGDSWSLLPIPYSFIHSGRIWEVDRSKVRQRRTKALQGETTFAESHGWRSLDHREEESGSKQVQTASHHPSLPSESGETPLTLLVNEGHGVVCGFSSSSRPQIHVRKGTVAHIIDCWPPTSYKSLQPPGAVKHLRQLGSA